MIKINYLTMNNRSLDSEFVVAPKYKLNTCYYGKSFSSMTLGLFCYLFDNRTFLSKYKHSVNKGADRRLCHSRNKYKSMKTVIDTYSKGNDKDFFNNWKNILVVRDPISRFISGYVQLCVLSIGLPANHSNCFKCGKNMHCFLGKLYNKIKTFTGIKTNHDHFLAYHFLPQKWRCEIGKYKQNYTILKYTKDKKNFYESYLQELRESGVPDQKLVFIKKLFYTTKVLHKTDGKKETKYFTNHLIKNKILIKMFLKIFYEDFIEFDFPLPNLEV
uniref:Sulfotransfer_1 domain-containing protein n=1 Tax=Parastrongyloides trichosuri TaxID=131310 RepID=A0A0N4Z6P8_PARTI